MALTAADNPSGFSTSVRDAWLSASYMSLFTQRSPLWRMMAMSGRIQPSGYGVQMREPLMVPVDTGPQLQGINNAYATIDAQPMTGFTQAEYPLSEYAINVSWQDYDMKRAGGKVEMVNWIQSIYENAFERSDNVLMNHLWFPPESPLSIGSRVQIMSLRTALNGGGTGATGAAILPPQASQSQTPVVAATGQTAQTTVGNIPRNATGAAYWCTPLINGDLTTPGATPLTVQTLNNYFEEAYQDVKKSPKLCICPPLLFGKLQNLLTVGGSNGGLMFRESDTARFGFHSLYFRGMRIVVDRRCPTSGFISGTATAVANHMFLINTDYLTLRMNGNKPKFKKVVEPKLIEEDLGSIYLALTSRHLGNVHALAVNVTS